MDTFVIIAFVFDLLMFLNILLKSFTAENVKAFKLISRNLDERTTMMHTKSKKEKTELSFIIAMIIVFIAIAFMEFIPYYWLIKYWISDGFIVGLRYMLYGLLMWPLMNYFRRSIHKKDYNNEYIRLNILMFISLLIIGITFTFVGFNFSLYDIIIAISENLVIFGMKNTSIIFFGSGIIASVIITFYCVIAKVSITLAKKKHTYSWALKYPFIIILLIISSYILILYLSELNTSLILQLDVINFDRTLGVVETFLGATIIPLIIGNILNIKNSSKEIKIDKAQILRKKYRRY